MLSNTAASVAVIHTARGFEAGEEGVPAARIEVCCDLIEENDRRGPAALGDQEHGEHDAEQQRFCSPVELSAAGMAWRDA